MRSRTILPAVAGAAVLAGAGCGGEDSRTFDDPRGAVSVDSGQEFRIELPESRSSGYSWRFRMRPDRSVVRFLGTGWDDGARSLHFKAVMPGRTTMVLANVRTAATPPRGPAAVRRIVVNVSG